MDPIKCVIKINVGLSKKKNKGKKVNPNRIRRLRRKNVENPKKGVSQKSIYQET